MASEWSVIDGLIVRIGKKRLIYPDPLSSNFLEAQCGMLNLMRLNGAEQPAIVERPKGFNPEDRLRARGMGIKLDGEAI